MPLTYSSLGVCGIITAVVCEFPLKIQLALVSLIRISAKASQSASYACCTSIEIEIHPILARIHSSCVTFQYRYGTAMPQVWSSLGQVIFIYTALAPPLFRDSLTVKCNHCIPLYPYRSITHCTSPSQDLPQPQIRGGSMAVIISDGNRFANSRTLIWMTAHFL